MVSRETSIAAALEEIAPGAFLAEASGRLSRYTEILEEVAIPRGFLGPSETDRLLERHVIESAALWPLVGGRGPLIDIGSGAGLPGLVLAILGVESVTLVDSQRRRVEFLSRVAAELAPGVDVRHGRAEELGRGGDRESFGTGIARALAPPPVALELALPLVRVGGAAVLLVGAPEQEPGWLESAARAADALGGGPPELRRFEVPGVDAARWVMIVEKLRETSDRFPRRAGVPARKPLG